MVNARDAELRDGCQDPRPRRYVPRRRGLSTAWLLLFGPVFLVLMAIVVEIGNIYVAHQQLDNALEAAALAAVLEWGGQPPAASTLDARLVGEQYGNANEICGQRLGDLDPIDPNYQVAPGGDANDNASCTGDLVFGAVSFDEPFVFQANVEPVCTVEVSGGSVQAGFRIDTAGCGGGDTTTFRCDEAFEFRLFSYDPPPDSPSATVSIQKISIRLQGVQGLGTDNGEFDFNITNPPTPTNPPAQENLSNGTVREGWGPFFARSSGIAPGNVSFYRDFDGTVPIGSPGQSDTLSILIANDDFEEGDRLWFGVDTDMVHTPPGGDQNDTADAGNQFKDAGPDFIVTFTFRVDTGTDSFLASVDIDGTEDQVKGTGKATNLPPGLSKQLLLLVPGTGNYAVHAQKRVSIPSLCGGVLGINTSWDVCAEATAMWRCGIEDVSLVHITDFQCIEP